MEAFAPIDPCLFLYLLNVNTAVLMAVIIELEKFFKAFLWGHDVIISIRRFMVFLGIKFVP